ncbi:helix-turn-helix transcriptional regulator [Thalassospiraceae bacterium LMO-JJ14]|nr:helix-turn-helix transcriptional regulator [Thalassospiraceae bacterium LMO-JJ14]
MSPAGIGRGRRQREFPPGTPHPVDVHVGSRVRLRRTMLGMSQEKLGEAVGLTFQQIQKYERGANRIGCSRIYQFSSILEVPVSFFFQDMPTITLPGSSKPIKPIATGMSDQGQENITDDPLARQETLELVRAYYRIQDDKIRKRLFDLLRSMANLPDES